MAKKRANGEGSKWFDEPKQLYRAAITTPAGKRLTKASKVEEVVDDWLNEQRLLVGRRQHIEPHSVTLGDWIDEWLEVYAKVSVRPRTYDRYVSLLAHAEPLDKQRLVNLLPSHFQKLYNSLDELSGTTRKHLHYCLSGCLQQAVKNKLIHRNPIDDVDAPKSKPKEIEIFTDDELAAIFAAAESTKYPVIFDIAIGTGMRVSEILALQRQHIDTKKSTIKVEKTVHYSISEGTHTCDPKTDKSRRTIKIDKYTMGRIRDHLLKTSGNILFPASHGDYLNPTTYLRYHYSKVREAAGLTKGFHSFRHTHATQLINAGVPVQEVSRRLGHSRVSTTADIYTHPTDDGEDNVVSMVDDIRNRINAKMQKKSAQ